MNTLHVRIRPVDALLAVATVLLVAAIATDAFGMRLAAAAVLLVGAAALSER